MPAHPPGTRHLDYHDAVRSSDPLFKSAGLALDLATRIIPCPMAMFVARPGPASPRLVVVKADPSLGTDPDTFAKEYIEVSRGTHPILDATTGASWVSLMGTKELNEAPEFSESGFAEAFLPHYGLESFVVLRLNPDSDEPDAAIAMFRTGAEPDFTDREKAFLRHSGPVLAHSYHCALEAESTLLEKHGHLAKLTDRELEIAKLASLGSRNDEIAEALQISPGTVKTHLRNIYSKLDVDSRVRLTLRLAGH